MDRMTALDAAFLQAEDEEPGVSLAIASIAVFEGPAPTTTEFSAALAGRLPLIPRYRQKAREVPWDVGPPVWVDDPGFDLGRHLSQIVLPLASAPAADPDRASDEQLLEIAATMVCTPLDRQQPLWAARWVTGLAREHAALILVMHHALTDGVGGLAVLAALEDEGPDTAADSFPLPPPRTRSLFAAAWRDRAVALSQVPGRLRSGRDGLRELGLRARRPTLVARTSLNRPTGPRRRLTTVQVPLMPLLDDAHRRGCRLNDLVLTAVAGAMAEVLRRRGERPAELVVSVPISARRAATRRPPGQPDRGRPVGDPDTFRPGRPPGAHLG